MRDSKRKAKEMSRRIAFFVILAILFGMISSKTESAMLKSLHLVPLRDRDMYRIRQEKPYSIDVIIVGDSLSYTSVSPMQLWKEYGFTSFVCGQWGQKIGETEYMLKTVLNRQKPKVVILEANVLFRKQIKAGNINDGIESGLQYYLPVFRGHDMWKSLVMKKKYNRENYKGFSFRCKVKPYEKGNYIKKGAKKKKLPDTTLTHMERIIDMCRESGSELVLLGTPSPVNYRYAKGRAISEYAKEKSLDWIDMNLLLKQIGIDWKTDSLDKGDHLNLSGAEKVTGYLGKYLSGKYDLPDHREDPAYASWASESVEYEKKAALHLKKIRGD